MNVLLFKRDLDKFSDNDILSIAKMYDLSGGVSDLKWLIAIKHSQKAPMLPVGEYEQMLILENLDDDALDSICQIKGYHDLCQVEYAKRFEQKRQKRQDLQDLLYWFQKVGDNPYFSDIALLENMDDTYLGERGIKELPNSFRHLKNLKNLNLHGNKLTKVPDVIKSLKGLEGLFLHNNKITEIPEFIGEMKNLKILYLVNNKIPQADIDALKEKLPNTFII